MYVCMYIYQARNLRASGGETLEERDSRLQLQDPGSRNPLLLKLTEVPLLL